MNTYQIRIFHHGTETEFVARNDNHAIRRVVKTLSGLKPIYSRAILTIPGGEEIDVAVNKNYGAPVTIGDNSYPAETWYESFPG